MNAVQAVERQRRATNPVKSNDDLKGKQDHAMVLLLPSKDFQERMLRISTNVQVMTRLDKTR